MVLQGQQSSELPRGIVREVTPLSLWGGDTVIYKSIIALAAIALPVIASVNLYLRGTPSWPQLGAAGSILLGALLCFALAKSGRRDIAAALLIGVLWFTTTIYSFNSGYGMHSAAVFVYLPCMLYTALFFGLAIASFELVLTVTVLVLMYLAEERGHIGGASAFITHGTNFNFLIGVIITCIGTLTVGVVYHRRVEREAARVFALAEQRRLAMERAQEAQAQLQTAHAKLQHLNDELAARSQSRDLEMERAKLDIDLYYDAVSTDIPASLQALREAIAKPDEQTEARLERELGRVEAVVRTLAELEQHARSPLRREPLDLAALAQEEVQRLQQTREFAHLRFDIDAGLRAAGDRRLVAVLLRHLFSRAAHACRTEPDSVIHFGSGSMGGRAVFFVRYDGPGAAQESEADIGIVSARRIVERHGGELSVDTAPSGTTIFFFLPRA